MTICMISLNVNLEMKKKTVHLFLHWNFSSGCTHVTLRLGQYSEWNLYVCSWSLFRIPNVIHYCISRNVLKWQVALQQCSCQNHRWYWCGSALLYLVSRHVTFSVLGIVVKSSLTGHVRLLWLTTCDSV